MPQPEVLEHSTKRESLFIGIPKECAFQEKRVPLVPEAVALLVSNGHKVYVESNLGLSSHLQIRSTVKLVQKYVLMLRRCMKQILYLKLNRHHLRNWITLNIINV